MAPDKDLLLEIANSVCTSVDVYEHRDQLSLIAPKENIFDLCLRLRDNQDTSFDMLMDITAIDWSRPKERFEVVYFLYSNLHKTRLRLKVAVDEKDPHVPSVTEVWESANWYERETFDMYGIRFENHPNLRRFYMPEDYVDPLTGESLFPLRKDFPLMGVPDAAPLPPFPEKYGETKDS